MIFDRLFGWTRKQSDRREHDASRKLSPAMPMAAAGAELTAERKSSETENALRRAVGDDRRRSDDAA
jgi:hypothetical protein